jgi:hypothetical protein
VLRRLKKGRNILRTGKREEADWIGHIFRKKCLLKEVTEETTEGNTSVLGEGRRRKRRKQLLDDLKEKEGTDY